MAFGVENLLKMQKSLLMVTVKNKVLQNFTPSSDSDGGVGGEEGVDEIDTNVADNNDTSSDNGASASDEYINAVYPGVLDTDLTSLTLTERTIFVSLLLVLFVLSMGGNIGTLHVNFRRKLRPFFRACLISLACSDLVNTLFLTIAYLNQYTAQYVQVWALGDFMCSFVPIMTTTAILTSSMTLVGIALYRYFAVSSKAIGLWKPSPIACVVFMVFIWVLALAISSPLFIIYDLMHVYILSATTSNTTDANYDGISTLTTPTSILLKNLTHLPTISTTPTKYISTAEATTTTLTSTPTPWQRKAARLNITYELITKEELVEMCVSNRKSIRLYYIIVFAIIFVPSIIAFIWLNSKIARKIWLRRHAPTAHRETMKLRKQKSKAKRSIHNADHVNVIRSEAVGNNPNPAANSSTTTIPNSVAITIGGAVAAKHHNCSHAQHNSKSSRETRHIRMFSVIILMMAIFLVFRLPAWIFLVMRMSGNYTDHVYWIVYFSFGILHITSCVLNPLFYTFLAETIQCAAFVGVKCCSILSCGPCLCFRADEEEELKEVIPQQQHFHKHGEHQKQQQQQQRQYQCYRAQHTAVNCIACQTLAKPQMGVAETVTAVSSNAPLLNCFRIYFGFCWFCFRCSPETDAAVDDSISEELPTPHSCDSSSTNSSIEGYTNCMHIVNSNDDEGVECCSDISESDGDSVHNHFCNIYSIYPNSLISSSVNSQPT